jgi:hypothetical protein
MRGPALKLEKIQAKIARCFFSGENFVAPMSYVDFGEEPAILPRLIRQRPIDCDTGSE